MIGAIITFIIVFAIGTVSNFHLEKKRRQLMMKLSEDSHLSANQLTILLKEMQDKIQETLIAIKNETPRGGYLRVYAVILQRGSETRIFIHPANTFEAMAEIVIKDFGKDWVIIASAYSIIESSPPSMPKPVLETVERKNSATKSNMANYIVDLEYARDHFADSPLQKRVIGKIINNIEKHYGTSITTSG